MRPEPALRPDLFTISVSFDDRLFRAKFTGLWDTEMFERYTEAALVEMRKFKSAGLEFDVLGDLTEYQAQPRDLSDLRQEFSQTARKMGLRKCAVVVSSVLVKSQVRRLTNFDQFFASEAEALAWIRQ